MPQTEFVRALIPESKQYATVTRAFAKARGLEIQEDQKAVNRDGRPLKPTDVEDAPAPTAEPDTNPTPPPADPPPPGQPKPARRADQPKEIQP